MLLNSKSAEVESSTTSLPGVLDTKGSPELDGAFKYLQKVNNGDVDTSSVNLARLRRKIDWHIVPVMFLCYTMAFLDKVNINYAAVMGLNADLNLRGNDFSNVSTAFFIAYLVAELPTGYILQKVPAGKWLGLNVTLWGIATACVAATQNYAGLLAVRIVLGAFEAAIAPCLMLIASQYYNRSEQAPRFGFWYCGLGFAQMLGGVISYGFQQVGPGHMAGWRIMFIVLGCVTIFIGVATGLVLPDSPMTAKWLTETEKVALLEHVGENRTGIQNTTFKPRQIIELFLDPAMWLMTFVTILISVSSGVITSYSSTLIKQFGYSSPISALLNIPGGAVSLIAIIVTSYGVRFTSHRWAWLAACCIPGVLGGGLMSFAPSSKPGALLAGVYLVNAITATLIIIYQWTMANVAGSTKRVVASVLISGSFSIGNIIGPQTFQAKDAPEYHNAKITVLATQAAGACFSAILGLYYLWANKQKEKKMAALIAEGVVFDSTKDSWGNLTDKENPEFRYVY